LARRQGEIGGAVWVTLPREGFRKNRSLHLHPPYNPAMEPQIKYALTEDGVSIAYWHIGEGTPLIWPTGGLLTSSLRVWRTPEGRELIERVAAGRMIVRYDARGFGNSQAGAVDFSLDARVKDLAAVVDRLETEQVDLCAYIESGPGVLAYAAAHPDRVAHLILWATNGSGTRWVSDETASSLTELSRVDFDLAAVAITAAIMRVLGIDSDQHEFARTMRDVITPEAARTFLNPEEVDATPILGDIRVPTMILHRRGIKDPSMGDVQTIAARIPNARLVILEGDSSVPYVGDTDALVSALHEFLGDEPLPSGWSPRSPQRGLATILFTDLVGHTEMMRRLGDEQGRDVLREHERITRDVLKQYGGAEVKSMGDGFMASFGSVTRAMDCAIALQQAFTAHEGEPLQVRVGLNAGEPIEEDGDLFGSTVIMASRIAAQAGAGEILIPEPLRHLLTGKSYVYADRGETMLKGFEDAVRLYEVRWRD
jgi:class 3 adenylate cyclase/pimeloyl-ACP methyl ester carboxylesterase